MTASKGIVQGILLVWSDLVFSVHGWAVFYQQMGFDIKTLESDGWM
jgi:hypothetical protein